MKMIYLAILTLVFGSSCEEKQNAGANSPKDLSNIQSELVYIEDNSTPTVDIPKYTLITDPNKDRKNDAKEILKVKRKWPLAMQSLNPLEFESILSKNFTFKGSDKFFTRADYIKNRTSPNEWKIIFVKYENVTLQFFGEIGILSYVNHITNRNVHSGAIENEQISWVDMYVCEDGEWKIGAAHSIDYRLEIPGNN